MSLTKKEINYLTAKLTQRTPGTFSELTGRVLSWSIFLSLLKVGFQRWVI